MSFEQQNIQFEPSEKEKREAKYQEMLKLASEVNDPIKKEKDEKDPKIINTVAVLWSLGISTSQSCEGHLDHGYLTPWVRIEAPGEPKQRFVNEEEIKTEIAKKFNKLVDEIEWSGWDPNNEIAKEFWQFTARNNSEQTEEFEKWVAENQNLYKKVGNWINEFNQARDVSEIVRINIIGSSGDDGFIIQSGNETEVIGDKERILELRQKEINDFTNFLKNKYLNE